MIATTIEQSKELVRRRLDPKTADMCFEIEKGNWTLNVGKKSAQVNRGLAIPAWSLSALLEVMKEHCPELLFLEAYWYCRCMQVESEYCDDPITAVYDVLCWLLERGLIEKEDNDE